MGQAKQRGDKPHRIRQAVEKRELFRPKSIVCEACKSEVTSLEANESRNIPGIDAVFSGTCQCGTTSFAIHGDPATAERLLSFLKGAMENEDAYSKAINYRASVPN